MRRITLLVLLVFVASSSSAAYAATGAKPTPKPITKVTTPKQPSFSKPLSESQMRDCLKTGAAAYKCAKAR